MQTSLHLVQSVYPRIQMLFDAPRVRQAGRHACTHAQAVGRGAEAGTSAPGRIPSAGRMCGVTDLSAERSLLCSAVLSLRCGRLWLARQHMDAWLELLVRQSCQHAQPSIASAAFQQMHALCQADTVAQRARAAAAAQRGEAFVPEPPRLRPAIILGPILEFFDESSLFGVDKERVSSFRWLAG